MDKFFSKRRNRLAYLLIVYLPIILSLLILITSDQSVGVQVADAADIVSSFSFFVGYVVMLPLSTLLGLVMLLIGWYKGIRKIEQDNAYRWLGSITIILNIVIIVGLSVLNS